MCSVLLHSFIKERVNVCAVHLLSWSIFIFFFLFFFQVEFPPTFEEQPMKEQWSWDQNPINLTCIATAIPNATITWWYRDREINREIIDRNYRVFGHGPRSDLIVTPLDLQYYGRYTCKAINPHGEAFYEIGMYASVENYVERKKKMLAG